MTKCEGTTKEEAMVNREKREALVKDKRVMQHFCKYEVNCEDGVGVVVLDYNHAINHVRHCLNSMKKFGTFATVKVEPEVCLEILIRILSWHYSLPPFLHILSLIYTIACMFSFSTL